MAHGQGGEQWRRRSVAALLGLLVLGIGIWIGGALAPDAKNSSPGTELEPDRQTKVNGVPLGYPRTRAGAVEAATNFTMVMASVPDNPDEYIRAAETMAAPEWQTEARRLASNGLEFLVERYGAGGSYTFAPLRYRVDSYTEHQATVSVWGVTVASGPKVAGIEESWLTGTLDLVWTHNDWRLAGQTSMTGPTPELLQTTAESTPADLKDFEEYGDAPRP